MLAAGAGAAVVIVVVALVAIPAARRWGERRDEVYANRERVRRYERLVASEHTLGTRLAQRRSELAALGVAEGVTPAVAASNVQSLLQNYVRASGATLDRVDVVGEAKVGDDGVAGIPVQLTAHGDIHGLVSLLRQIEEGGELLLVDELTISKGAIREDAVEPLSFTLRLRAVWAPPAEAS